MSEGYLPLGAGHSKSQYTMQAPMELEKLRTGGDESTRASSHTSSGSTLSYQHLSFSVSTKKGSKVLLDDVSVDIKAGELLAIMGPSGAGEFSFLILSWVKMADGKWNDRKEYATRFDGVQEAAR